MEIFGGDELIRGIENQAQITAADPRYKAWWDTLPPDADTGGLEPPTN